MLYQLSYFRKKRTHWSLLYSPNDAASEICALQSVLSFLWEVMDSNHRKRTLADLQSAPFGHSGNFPITIRIKLGADGGIRTPDQLITNQLLWPTELHRHFVRFGLQK